MTRHQIFLILLGSLAAVTSCASTAQETELDKFQKLPGQELTSIPPPPWAEGREPRPNFRVAVKMLRATGNDTERSVTAFVYAENLETREVVVKSPMCNVSYPFLGMVDDYSFLWTSFWTDQDNRTRLCVPLIFAPGQATILALPLFQDVGCPSSPSRLGLLFEYEHTHKGQTVQFAVVVSSLPYEARPGAYGPPALGPSIENLNMECKKTSLLEIVGSRRR